MLQAAGECGDRLTALQTSHILIYYVRISFDLQGARPLSFCTFLCKDPRVTAFSQKTP